MVAAGAAAAAVLMPAATAAYLLLLLAAAAPLSVFSANPTKSSGPVELTPSVIILGEFDVVPYQASPDKDWGYTSRCTDMVGRVASHGVSSVSFIATQYWRSRGVTADERSDLPPEGYCVMQGTNGKPNCKKTAKSDIDAFASGMALCFKAVMDRGLKGIALKTHLDDSSRKTAAWRNTLRFSPITKYDGYSYAEIMLYPLADALGASIKSDTDVWFALQGEMSTTTMMYPREWLTLVSQIRQRIVSAAASRGVAVDPSKIRIGLSQNFNKIDTGGLITPGSKQLYTPAAMQQAAITGSPGGSSARFLDVSGVRALHQTLDFVGISSYAALAPDFPLNKLQDAAFMFFDEFKAATTVDLLAIMKAKDMELHYSEYGLGGGISNSGTQPATTAKDAAHTPFFGVWGSYSAATDPWRNPEVRSYLHDFYRRTLDWLAGGGGPTYFITACFLWNTGSWDVLGIYPESTVVGQGSYLDPVVSDMIRRHNTGIATARVTASGGR